mmetsp:Transcript_23645/g.62611  ORF Transcript_23645/g.62611 Transcript_23645/m.62611 type:complete len:511 (-) Transcript_23645:186-1718(-)
MVLYELVEFLVGAQDAPDPAAAAEEAARIMLKFGHENDPAAAAAAADDQDATPAARRALSSYEFAAFLYSPDNGAVSPHELSSLTHPLDRPLAEYLVCSSHNTYLSGNQLTGKSSAGAYSAAIRRGCRCVELDVWDGEDGHPSIFHGHTLTKPVGFADVIEAIATEAFAGADEHPYAKMPFILSFENHCGPKQTAEMAAIMLANKHFMARVVRRPRDGDDPPLMSDLMGKFIVKSKVKDDSPPEFVDLVWLVGAKFKSFEESIAQPWNYIHSYSESKLKEILEPDHAAMRQMFMKYNATHVSRTYPMGTRVDSSNYNPTPCWQVGAQIVALNFQQVKSAMITYLGMFQQNGCSGYVLKPDYLMARAPMPKPTWFAIKVISGHSIPQEPGEQKSFVNRNTYVSVGVTALEGVEYGESVDANHTETVKDNALTPIYTPLDGKSFKFMAAEKDLSVVTFKLKEAVRGKDPTVGYASVALSVLRPGYRMLPVRDTEGLLLGMPHYLFIHTEFLS